MEDSSEGEKIASSEELVQALRRRRVNQLCGITLGGIVAATLALMIKGNWPTWGFVGAGIVPMAVAYRLNATGRTGLAGAIVLWALAIIGTLAMWFNQGLYSSGIVVFPCALVIANMFGQQRQFFALLAYMLGAVAVVTWAQVSGHRQFQLYPFGIAQGVYAAIILLVCASMIFLLASDLRRALERLAAEIGRVNESQAQLRHQATHDALTGLPNRLLGRQLVDKALAKARRMNARVGLMFVDLDNFKNVNDSLGHQAGDELLGEVAQRLTNSMRAYDSVIRHGGDEFLLLLPDVTDAEALAAAAGHLLVSMAEPFQVRGLAVASSCSIGIAMYPPDGADFDVLLQKADIAVQHAKDAGRNLFRFFDDGMNANMLEDLNLNTSLRGAVERGEFLLHYQPIINLADGRVIGAEALLRWIHPERGMIPPGRFIPVAERSGQIVEIGEWVLDEACRQIAAWQGSPLAGLVVSVNVSMIQFKRGTIEAVVAAALERHGVPPACLELEMTESALIHDPESFVATLGRLKRLGVRLAIDDFGTGYSNLSYLQRFEVDKLKIDQSFIRNLCSNGQDQAIVLAIIQMAASLRLTTTGEGIENEPTRLRLLELGCDQGQGYGLGRPQPLEMFEGFCRDMLGQGKRAAGT